MCRNNIFPIRLSLSERRIIEEKAKAAKFSNLTSYIRHLLLSKDEPEQLILLKEIHYQIIGNSDVNHKNDY